MYLIEFYASPNHNEIKYTVEVTWQEYLYLEKVRIYFLFSDDPVFMQEEIDTINGLYGPPEFDPWFEEECYEHLCAALKRKRMDKQIDKLIQE